jgi:hypothetical protein
VKEFRLVFRLGASFSAAPSHALAQWLCGFVIPDGCGTATILRFPNYFIALRLHGLKKHGKSRE